MNERNCWFSYFANQTDDVIENYRWANRQLYLNLCGLLTDIASTSNFCNTI